MSNPTVNEQLSDPSDEYGALSPELSQKFDNLLYNIGEKLEVFAVPESLETNIDDIKFGRLGDGSLSVGSTTTQHGYDARIEYTDADDAEQNINARYTAQLKSSGWMVNGNQRWSSRRVLQKIESQWPTNDDDSVAHQDAKALVQNDEAAKTLTPERIVELAETYALLNDTGTKSSRAHYDYEGTIHSDDTSGSERVFSTFRLDKDDRYPDMTACQFEINFPSQYLTYTIARDQMGMISMHAKQTSEFSGKTYFLPVQDPEAIYECLSTIGDNMVDDKSHTDE